MTCAAIEELILNESEPAFVDALVRQCDDCMAFREASLELDTVLMRPRQAPDWLNRAVLTSIAPKPNYLPELLDFADWAAMITVMFGLSRNCLRLNMVWPHL
jgi:hypothetical protein